MTFRSSTSPKCSSPVSKATDESGPVPTIVASTSRRGRDGAAVIAGPAEPPRSLSYRAAARSSTSYEPAAESTKHDPWLASCYPLARAFDMGAAGWSQERRTAFANDTDLELLAVDGRANQVKGDSGPAQWLPPNPAETCGYLRRYIDVAATYELAITAAEHDVMARILTGCG